jgi:hypothetical protein
VNGVTVVIVEYKHVSVACTGRSEKTAWLVSVDLASDTLMGDKDMVGAGNGWAVMSGVGMRCYGGSGGTDGRGLGGPEVGSLLVEMAFDHGWGVRRVLAHLTGGNVREGG